MLKSIEVRDFAVLHQVSLEFEAGLTALTGETGAGKSILIDALMLCLGGRASTEWIRAGADKLDVQATFSVENHPDAQAWLNEQELNADDDTVQLRRVINSDGKSKAFINGRSQPLGQVREIGALLCEIHGQQEFLSLMNSDAQRRIIDQRGIDPALLSAVEHEAREILKLDQDMDRLRQAARDRDARLSWLNHQVEELNAFGPQPNEESALRATVQRLAHRRRLVDGMAQTQALLADTEGQDVLSLLGKAHNQLKPLTELDGRLQSVQTLLADALIQVKESSAQLEHWLTTEEADPEQLEAQHQRLAQYEQLARKHRVAADELCEVLHSLSQEQRELSDADSALSAKQLKRDHHFTRYRERCAQLSSARQAIAEQLSLTITQLLSHLGMPAGRFAIEVKPTSIDDIRTHGQDAIEFLVSANAGMPLKPVAKIASGGELSRISLAIQVAAAHAQQGRFAMVFDEIDAGVGGAVAEMVGRELKQLSQTTQVLCVTHLPQVAAQARSHIRVLKRMDGQSTRTELQWLSEADRVEEIARMLAGVNVTDSARSHARTLLESARTPTQGATPSSASPSESLSKTRARKAKQK